MISWLQRLWRRVRREPDSAAARAGRRGERLAAEFLRDRAGYGIVARNWRSPRDRRAELDLVCRDGDVLVFVEVKTRAETALVPGYYAVDERKKKALRRAIHAYLAALRRQPRTFRFDVAEVVLGAAVPPQVLHFQNIPLFPKGYQAMR